MDSLKVGQSETSEGSQGIFFPSELEKNFVLVKTQKGWLLG